MATPHLDADTLAAYVDGRLAVTELSRADHHIDACGSCRRELSSLAAIHTQPIAPAADAPEGSLGRYHILRELGRGSMGIVLRAYDPELARPVAIKLLRDLDPSTRELVRGEARALARLRHGNVVTVYDVIDDGDRMYIAMELVEGDTLRGYCEGKPLRDVLAACVRAGRGLAAAHDAGVIHRDFKPENVLCTPGGEARVSDFGLARAIDDAPHERTLSGTPAYMAPEVLRGEPASPASDQYSFCVATCELISGARPAGDRRPDAIPVWIWRVLQRGLSREVTARYPSMAAMLAELEDDPQVRRRRRALLATGALAAVAIGALAVHFAMPRAPSCAIDDTVLGDAWNAARHAEVTRAIAAVAGDDIATKVAASLDDYAAGWVASRRDACEATRVRGEQPEAVLERRVACLDRGRRELGELARVLATSDARLAGAAREAVGRLPDPAACSAADAPPDDPAGEADRAAIDHANVLQVLGKDDDALGVLAPLIARPALRPQLLAEALLVRAHVEIDRAHVDQTEQTLFDALRAAEQAHADALVATIWVDLVMTTGAQNQRFDVAMSNARAADAALARVDADLGLQLRYDYSLGALLLAHGDLEAARKRFEAGLALAGDAPRRSPQAGLMRIALCDTDRQLGKLAIAHEQCDKGLALVEAAFGRDHIRVANALNTVGALAFGEHDLAAAERAYQRAADIFERRDARDQLVYALALFNLGSVAATHDDPERARTMFERSLAVFDAHYPKHPQRLLLLQGLANLALRRGDAAGAIPLYEQVRDGTAAAYSADSPALAIAEYNLALAYRSAKQPARAQALADALAAHTLAKESWTMAANALDLEASLAEDRGDLAGSVALRERALAALSHTTDAATRADIERQLGEAHLALHRPDRALALVEDAVAYFEKNAEEPIDVGVARFALARALWDSGRDRRRAMELAKLAQDDLTKAQTGDDLQSYRDQLARWLRDHR